MPSTDLSKPMSWEFNPGVVHSYFYGFSGLDTEDFRIIIYSRVISTLYLVGNCLSMFTQHFSVIDNL